MGIFFENRGSNSPLTPLLETAYRQDPPEGLDLHEALHGFTAEFNPVQAAVRSALLAPPPTDAGQAAQSAAQAAVNSLSGSATFQSGRFAVALLIFLALLGTAIGCDASGLTTSTTALYSLVASVFGVIVGFIGGEKSA